MMHWNQCLDLARKKDKAFARFCQSREYQYLTKEQAKAFIGLLVEYGSRPKWRPVIGKVLEHLNRIHGEKNEAKKETPVLEAGDQASVGPGDGGDATGIASPGAEPAGSSAVTSGGVADNPSGA